MYFRAIYFLEDFPSWKFQRIKFKLALSKFLIVYFLHVTCVTLVVDNFVFVIDVIKSTNSFNCNVSFPAAGNGCSERQQFHDIFTAKQCVLSSYHLSIAYFGGFVYKRTVLFTKKKKFSQFSNTL